jgi:hypothetical protein
LGNTVGALAGPAYVIFIAAAMFAIPLFGLAILNSTGFGGDMLTQVILNPLGGSLPTAVQVGLALLNELVPLGLVIQAAFWFLGFRLSFTKVLWVANAVVRAFAA